MKNNTLSKAVVIVKSIAIAILLLNGCSRRPNPSITHTINSVIVFKYTSTSDRLSTNIGSNFESCSNDSEIVVIKDDKGNILGSAPLQPGFEEVVGHHPIRVKCRLPFQIKNVSENASYDFHLVSKDDPNPDKFSIVATGTFEKMRELDWSPGIELP